MTNPNHPERKVDDATAITTIPNGYSQSGEYVAEKLVRRGYGRIISGFTGGAVSVMMEKAIQKLTNILHW